MLQIRRFSSHPSLSEKMTTPKLTKDQIQKVALCAGGFVALLYVYFSFFLGPLNRSRATMQATIADLQAKLGNSKSELQRRPTWKPKRPPRRRVTRLYKP